MGTLWGRLIKRKEEEHRETNIKTEEQYPSMEQLIRESFK